MPAEPNNAGYDIALPPMRPAYIKYLNILRVSLIERLTYRGDFLLGTVLRFLPMVTTILLWHAIFAGAADADPNVTSVAEKKISGYTYDDMIAYLLLVHISRMFSSMPGLAAGIARDIRDGSLKKYLLQPIALIPYLFSYRVAHKTAYITTSCVPYAVLFFLCRDFFHWPDAITLAGYIASLLLGFLIGFFFEACVGMVGFWFLEVTSLLYVVNTLNFIISGQMFPLDLLPVPFPQLLKLLPFKYMAYFPAAVFLGRVQGAELAEALAIEVVWVVAFAVLSRWLYKIGLRRYSAYGG
jgi:ABC-2 type transport system permease protein